VQRYRYRCGCGHQGQGYRDESLDESGYLPECLRRIHGTTLRMSYREAEAWLGEWGVKVGKSSLQVLGIRLEQHEQGLSRDGRGNGAGAGVWRWMAVWWRPRWRAASSGGKSKVR